MESCRTTKMPNKSNTSSTGPDYVINACMKMDPLYTSDKLNRDYFEKLEWLYKLLVRVTSAESISFKQVLVWTQAITKRLVL